MTMAQTRADELRATIEAARAELYDLEMADKERDASALIGHAIKYRNNYSLPQSEADYWWMYAIVTEQRDGIPFGLTFQCDKDGEVTITHDSRVMALWPGCDSGWQECSFAEARQSWERIIRTVRAAADRAFLVSRRPAGGGGGEG